MTSDMALGAMYGTPCSFRKLCKLTIERHMRTRLTPAAHRPGKKWKHEDASEMMFDDLRKLPHVDISDKDATIIKALIAGDKDRCM